MIVSSSCARTARYVVVVVITAQGGIKVEKFSLGALFKYMSVQMNFVVANFIAARIIIASSFTHHRPGQVVRNFYFYGHTRFCAAAGSSIYARDDCSRR